MMKQGNLDNQPVLTIAAMRALEERVIHAGIPGYDLMRLAGWKVAEMAHRLYPDPDRQFLILAGPGNNGGDGFITAQSLHEMGRDVRLIIFCGRDEYKGDAAKALADCQVEPLPLQKILDCLNETKLVIIDALFGIGLTRPLGGIYEACIRAVLAHSHPVIAIDIPSGIEADSGKVMGIALSVQHTVTFAAPKMGHLLFPGRSYTGHLHIADIGLGAVESTYRVNAPTRIPSDVQQHKYKRGYNLILGSAAMPGAAMLAAKAARRVGAGMVAMAAPKETQLLHLSYQPGLIFHAIEDEKDFGILLKDQRIGSVIIGCGFLDSPDHYVDLALSRQKPLILDGGAIKERAPFTYPAIVMTPHEGEFARAFPRVKGDSKWELALNAAKESKAIIVLKGPDTIIAAPDGKMKININAGPELATAGSGDVLAGIIGGLMAQGLPAFEAASMGVWLHGAAASQKKYGLIAEDIPDLLPPILQELQVY